MKINVEILSVSVNSVGKYKVAEVAYKDLKEGKVNGKKVVSFVNQEVFNTISKAKPGDKFSIEIAKDDKGYWQWTEIEEASTDAGTNQVGHSTSTPVRSTYETPEERKQRQDFIIRQSSISSAISLLKTEKNVPAPDDVLQLATAFVAFVYNKKTPEQQIIDMKDDIPT